MPVIRDFAFDEHAFSGGGPAERNFNTGTGVDSGNDIVTTDAAHGYADGDAIYYQDQGGTKIWGWPTAHSITSIPNPQPLSTYLL